MRVLRSVAVIALAVAACAATVGVVPASADDGRQTKAYEPYCDEGACCDPDVECGWDEEDGGAFQGSPDQYAYSPDAYYGRCKTVWAARTRKNYFGAVMFRYFEQVRWCWNGITITSFWRERWPSDTGYGWSFDGNTATNCSTDHCEDLPGGYSAAAWTQGEFHACLTWYCIHKYPVVSIGVYADGSYGYSTSG